MANQKDLETNIKVVAGGRNLTLSGKIVEVKGAEYDIHDLNKICTKLLFRYKIPATPYSCKKESYRLLINDKHSCDNISFVLKKGLLKYKVTLKDNSLLKLTFRSEIDRPLLGDLYKKALIVNILKSNGYWNFDSSRIFYEREAFQKGGKDFRNQVEDISVFRRFEVSDVILDVGIGVSVEVGTGFFTNKNVEYYHVNNVTKRFDKLTSRQKGQTGTLLYKKPGGGYSKCYFTRYDYETTCGSTNPFTYEGENFKNLLDYYERRNRGKCEIQASDPVAWVRFKGIKGDVPVAANRLFIRVMNDMLPLDLSQLDKISPEERDAQTESFWNQFGATPFGEYFRGFEYQGRNFKPLNRSGLLDIPTLEFNNQVTLRSPQSKEAHSYRENFRRRKSYLLENGCFFAPFEIDRNMYFVHPESVDPHIVEQFSNDVCELASNLTGVEINPILDSYSNYREMLDRLSQHEASTVIFIFDRHEASAYFTISHELKLWDIKRVTSSELIKKFKQGQNRGGRWASFIELNTFDILQQLGCVPWTCNELNYDMHLAIDVSEKFTHFCFSFYMFNGNMVKPVYKTDIFSKTNQEERINKEILESKLTSLFDQWSTELIQYRPRKLLIIRDGKVCDGEIPGIANAIENQKQKSHLMSDFHYDIVEYHKSTQKSIRLWRTGRTKANVLEGTYAILNETEAVLSPTGSATLNQGTSQPILIKTLDKNISMLHVLQDLFSLAQLNYSSPTVAQSNSLPIKQADDQLIERKSQEIEKIK